MNSDDNSWPPFLGLMDSDPNSAADLFCRFAMSLLETKPPRIFRSLSVDEQSDLTTDIVIHCIDMNFRILRKYEDKGSPFAAWFYFIARNKAIDYIRRKDADVDVVVANPETGFDPLEITEDRRAYHAASDEVKEMLDEIDKCWMEMSEKCRLLLKLAAREYKAQEMAELLRKPKDMATKIANDLGYCRKKLTNLLSEKGLAPEEFLKRLAAE